MARWTRAARELGLLPGSKVLDLGCAFGFGTRILARKYRAYGHDLSQPYIERARRSVTHAVFTLGPADEVPYPDGYFDGVLLLDVLEHVPNEASVVQEVARVLRPGGTLVVSVPNRGLLFRADSLNLYRTLVGRRKPPPTDDPSWERSPRHRHYDLPQLTALLQEQFRPVNVRYSGLGVAELVNLVLLLLLRAAFDAPRLYGLLQYLYFGVYLAEDLIPAGRWGYHLMLTCERTESA